MQNKKSMAKAGKRQGINLFLKMYFLKICFTLKYIEKTSF